MLVYIDSTIKNWEVVHTHTHTQERLLKVGDIVGMYCRFLMARQFPVSGWQDEIPFQPQFFSSPTP